MRKFALLLAVALAACFTMTGAEAAKKRAAAKPTAPVDAAYQWNLKNIPPMAAASTAAKPEKAAKKSKKKS
jgi:hypothetical protein